MSELKILGNKMRPKFTKLWENFNSIASNMTRASWPLALQYSQLSEEHQRLQRLRRGYYRYPNLNLSQDTRQGYAGHPALNRQPALSRLCLVPV